VNVARQKIDNDGDAAGKAGRRRIPVIWYSVALLVFLGILFQAGNRNFLSAYNLLTILDFTVVMLLVGLGQMSAILNGGIDLSVGGVMSFSSVVFVITVSRIGALAYPLCMSIGLVVGIINGNLLTRIRIPSFIATLGTGGILMSLSMVVAPVPVIIPFDSWEPLRVITGKALGINNTLWLGGLVFLLYFSFYRFAIIGRHIYAIGSNIRMSWMSGINVTKARNWAFVLSGLGASAAGIMVSSVQYGSNPYLGETYILNSIAAVVVGGTALTGGTGGPLNTLLGALILSVLRNGMNVVGIDQYFQQSILGFMIVVAVILTFDRQRTGIIK
jgi:ribose transport system permease protein